MARALFASIIATAVVSALVYANTRLSLLPAFDLLDDIADFNARIGLPSTTQARWVTHGLTGIFLLGLLYAIIRPILPGQGATRGMWYGAFVWLTMMISFMPLTAHGIFGHDLGPGFAAIMLMLNLIYGGVLGMTYSSLGDNTD